MPETGAGVRVLGWGGKKVQGEGEVGLWRQLCGLRLGYVPGTLSSRRPFALTGGKNCEGRALRGGRPAGSRPGRGA